MTSEEVRQILTGGMVTRHTVRLEDPLPSLLVPVRMDVFGTVTVEKRKGRKIQKIQQSAGWQARNVDPVMEAKSARLAGSGSFYWASPITALAAGKRLLRENPDIHQIKLETISGREIGRLYRRDV